MKNTQEKGFMQEITDNIHQIPQWLKIGGGAIGALIAMEQQSIADTLKVYLAIDGKNKTEIISDNPNCAVDDKNLTLECKLGQKRNPTTYKMVQDTKSMPIFQCIQIDDSQTKNKFGNKPIVPGSGKMCEIGDESSTVEKSNRNVEKSFLLTSFSEIKKFLEKRDIDLEKIQEQETRNMVRWGIIEQKDAEKYKTQLENMTLDPKELEGINLKDQRIVLGVDNMTNQEAFQKYIIDAGIPNYIWKNFSEYEKIDPRTKKPLSDQNPSDKAGILFTPNNLNLPKESCNLSANQQLEKMAKGQKIVGPIAEMKMFRESLDYGLSQIYPNENIYNLSPEKYKKLIQKGIEDEKINQYLLDFETITQFPNLKNQKSGAVPYLGFGPYFREVFLRDCFPGDAGGGLGVRSARGSFLS